MATTQNYSWPSSSQVVITGIGNPTGQPVPADAVFVAGEDPSGNLHGLQTDSTGALIVTIEGTPGTPLSVKDVADGSVTGGTAGTFSQLSGGIFNSTLPTLTTGQQAAVQVDSHGREISVPGTPVALTVSQKALAVGTSAVRLTVSGAAPASSRVTLVANADSASTGKFYIGSSTVTSSGATRGIQLIVGQTFIANSDAGDYFIISDTAAQTVYVLEQE